MSEDSRYILAKKIARGGMAEIYLGKHVGEDGFQRLCAIKRILPHYAQDKEFIEMFRDEAHICKRLQHANIVRVEGFEEVEGSYAIIMEFVDGSDLRSLLSSCEKAGVRLSVPMAVFVAAEAARGLHYAHTKLDEITQQPLNIVHRDISPQNILLSYEGEIKITDFGIADAGSKITETKPGIVKGKYSYMSPEQISAKQVDARTDVFALAIVLWEMLAMKRLFQGENEVDTINLVRACRIPGKMTDFNPNVDEELEQILLKGLARDIRKRHVTAGDFERELRRHLARKYPTFTAEDLGTFLKSQLAARREESAGDIKKTLTETNQKPSSKASGRKRSLMDDGVPMSSKDVVLENPGQGIPLMRKGSSSLNRPQPTGLGSLATPRSNLSLGSRANSERSPHPPVQFHRNRSKRSPGLALVVAALLVIGGIWAFLQHGDSLTARKPAQLVITSTPEVVRILVNGKRQFDGGYKKTPVGLNLPPGKHVIMVQRPGYQSETFEFVGNSGETVRKDDIVLEARVSFAPTRITLVNVDAPQVHLDIGSGFASTVIQKGREPNFSVSDLAFDRTHRLRVRLPATGRQFACDFAPKSASWRAPAILTVDVAQGRCILRNPRGS